MSMKISIDTIGNRTRDLLACSAVPQTNAPPRTPETRIQKTKRLYMLCAFFGSIIIIIIIINYSQIFSSHLTVSTLRFQEEDLKLFRKYSMITMSIFFYCCTVHFDNIKILFTNKCTLLLNI